MKENTKTKTKLTRKHYIIIGGVVLVTVSLVATIIYLITVINKKEINDSHNKLNNRPTVISEDNIEDFINQMDEPVPDGSYEVVMNTEWIFKDNKSNAYIENSINNTRTVYFDLFLSDTQEMVYSSPYIPVGEKIQGFVLDADLEVGEYSGRVTYYLVDEENEIVSELSVSVIFEVQ